MSEQIQHNVSNQSRHCADSQPFEAGTYIVKYVLVTWRNDYMGLPFGPPLVRINMAFCTSIWQVVLVGTRGRITRNENPVRLMATSAGRSLQVSMSDRNTMVTL